eukprot:scaffold757_cov246-Pinguiococcus_pyrenoidosus.AAC.39
MRSKRRRERACGSVETSLFTIYTRLFSCSPATCSPLGTSLFSVPTFLTRARTPLDPKITWIFAPSLPPSSVMFHIDATNFQEILQLGASGALRGREEVVEVHSSPRHRIHSRHNERLRWAFHLRSSFFGFSIGRRSFLRCRRTMLTSGGPFRRHAGAASALILAIEQRNSEAFGTDHQTLAVERQQNGHVLRGAS